MISANFSFVSASSSLNRREENTANFSFVSASSSLNRREENTIHNMLSVISSSSHWILSLKLLLLSSTLLSMAVLLKFSVPVAADILVSDVPAVWRSVIFWLRPPYLYLLVNFIIISILASAKLHQDLMDPPPAKLSDDPRADFTVRTAVGDVLEKNENLATDFSENDVKLDVENEENREKDQDSVETSFQKYVKKPPISSKIIDRKSAKPTAPPPAGKMSSGAEVTLDDTWKAIAEGQTAPLSRRLDKSDTWESNGRRDETAGVRRNGPPAPKVKKSETSFNERGDGGKNQWAVKKKPSLTEEELNRRVEAFIEKFKEEMRLQREESLKKFHEMISQGGY